MRRNVILSLLCLFLTLSTWASDYQYKRNIHYRPTPTGQTYTDSMCVLDIAYPKDASNAPVVIWFHGGGLTAGHRELPIELLKEGLVVWVLNTDYHPKRQQKRCWMMLPQLWLRLSTTWKSLEVATRRFICRDILPVDT